jgi:ribonuclease P protein component
MMERHREQADLSAEQPPPGQDPWLPASHAHPRGSRNLVRAPAQEPYRTVGLSFKLQPTVLPAPYRLRDAADFTAVTRRGRRARAGSVMMYLLDPAPDPGNPGSLGSVARVGLVVGKSVGGSVVRHRVSRRLRAQLAARIDRVPGGAKLVVRALPESATASSPSLANDLDRGFRRLGLVSR